MQVNCILLYLHLAQKWFYWCCTYMFCSPFCPTVPVYECTLKIWLHSLQMDIEHCNRVNNKSLHEETSLYKVRWSHNTGMQLLVALCIFDEECCQHDVNAWEVNDFTSKKCFLAMSKTCLWKWFLQKNEPKKLLSLLLFIWGTLLLYTLFIGAQKFSVCATFALCSDLVQIMGSPSPKGAH